MIDPLLFLPIAIIFCAAALPVLFGLPALNQRLFHERLSVTQLSWFLALAPLAAFAFLVSHTAEIDQGTVFIWEIPWIPTLDLSLSLYLDGLSLLFALIITFIGILIIVYTGQYFKGDPSAWRFLTYILLFMAAMLGLVMAGDIITLFIFWEMTSIVSYLLVAYKYKDKQARDGAFKALFITGGGGIALLAGLLFVSYTVGGTSYAAILNSGDILRNSPFYLVMLSLVAFGAFTKSAQFPAHIWLPGAMSAPTPASAYLHSATMVKAGIYLLARLNPALGFTEAWFLLLTFVGLVSMLTGAYLGLKQNDLKALLAYSTISQLGVFVMLIGQDVETAYKALVIGVLAHALYKSSLFMAVGIVDHETGTRDLRRLGGLRRSMPIAFGITTLAALSMAGLPPLFGFLAKETLLATAVHPSLPASFSWLLTAASVAAGALLLAQAGMLVWDTFMGKPRDPSIHGHEPVWPMLLAPAIPALLSLLFALLPSPKEEAIFLAKAASAAYSQPVSVSTKLWTGLNVPFVLSLVAISLGTLLFIFRQPVRSVQARVMPNLSFNALYGWVLKSTNQVAFWATRLQQGKLRNYLVIILLAALLLVLGFSNRFLLPVLLDFSMITIDFAGELTALRIFTLYVAVGASLATVWLRRDFFAILAVGAFGLSIAVFMLLEPAPDVALVQIVVDILATVVLVLALTRLPRKQRRQAQDVTDVTFRQRPSLVRDTLIAVSAGIIVSLISLTALLSRPHATIVTPYYEQAAKPLTGAADIVGAIVVDFRALDTLIEITVFSVAGLGIYTLLRYAARKFGDAGRQVDELPPADGKKFFTFGIGGARLSSFIRTPAYVTLPLTMILAATQMMYGHDQPGDGFTAGVIIGLAVGLWYIVFGYEEIRQRLPWLKGVPLIGAGILLAIVNGIVTELIRGNFLANVDYGELIALPLPKGFHISSSFLFELAICLAVLGSVALMLNSLGHPGREDRESTQRLREIREQEHEAAHATSRSFSIGFAGHDGEQKALGEDKQPGSA